MCVAWNKGVLSSQKINIFKHSRVSTVLYKLCLYKMLSTKVGSGLICFQIGKNMKSNASEIFCGICIFEWKCYDWLDLWCQYWQWHHAIMARFLPQREIYYELLWKGFNLMVLPAVNKYSRLNWNLNWKLCRWYSAPP